MQAAALLVLQGGRARRLNLFNGRAAGVKKRNASKCVQQTGVPSTTRASSAGERRSG